MKDKRFVEYWGIVRGKGRIRYLLTRGFLLFGGGYMLFWSAFGIMIIDLKSLKDATSLFKYSLVGAGVAFVFGLIMGSTLWYVKEKRYSLLHDNSGRIKTPWDQRFMDADQVDASPKPPQKKK